ncbi:rRNA maturation RNase YbeY [Flavobacteriaceae bacterium S356]|uniref:Endoribonuclease YbeY n=1 Tax=Asprobacillus argus TaxID=3076534 RepID=A0ABU3LCQ2_9FLAO|nr:rRNA maturation RNase YbeY [Flavobacteriaceae bacterium S356]
MILFNYVNDFSLQNEEVIANWITKVLEVEGYECDDVNYIFCDDEYLHELNVKYLNHDTLTDIISFDNSMEKKVAGDIFISTERVAENAKSFNVSFNEELSRVIIHGMLHFMGYKDKTEEESREMRTKENEAISLLNI